MAYCRNRIGERCKLDGEVCKHLVYDGNCKFADVDSVPRATFRNALDAIIDFNPESSRLNSHKRAFNIVMERLGLSWDDSIESFEYEVAKTLSRELELVYASSTVGDILGSIYFAGNPKLRSFYKTRKIHSPVFERYQYRVVRKPKLSLTWEQTTAIKYEMERLRLAALDTNLVKRKRDMARNLFIMLWWGWWFGTRPGDINRMKWGNVIYINGVPHVKWIPHKTMKSTGAEITWPIPSDGFNQIHKLIGEPDEYCVTTDEKFVPKNAKRKRHGIHTYYWKYLNRFFRKLGIRGWAGFYALRYMNAQNTAKMFGEAAEHLKLGHGERVGRGSYYNHNDHSI